MAGDSEIEVAQGVTYAAWTYNGTVPGPVLRATEGDIFRVEFTNQGSHPHTIHFHGVHPANMDGVFKVVPLPRPLVFTYGERPMRTAFTSTTATRRPAQDKHVRKGPLRRAHQGPARAPRAG